MKTLVALALSICCALLPLPRAAAAEGGGAEKDWRAEFEEVCSKTDASMTMTDEELAQAVARCDGLLGRIGAEPDVVQRVYLKRLQKCRDLFAYVLETRKAAPQAGTASAPSEAAPAPGAAARPDAPATPAAPASTAPAGN
jgi:hypothetical protein